MSVNMADIVQIPIEAFNAIQHSHSIYKFCIYSKATAHGLKEHFVRLAGNNELELVVDANAKGRPACLARE